MSTPVRLLVPAAVLVLLTGCSTGTDPGAGPAPSAAPATAPTGAAPSPATAAEGTVIDVSYTGGRITGVASRVPVAVGERVLLRVTSDVAEQVHVHGYDVSVDIPAGGTGEVAFVADQPGSWEVELHEAGRPLFSLRVS